MTMKADQRKSRMLLRYWDLYLLLSIPLIMLFVFKYIPIFGNAIAFYEYDIFANLSSSEFVGLDNFRRLFSLSEFRRVLRNTLLISVYKLLFYFPLPIVLAIMLNEVKAGFRRPVQTIVYLPHFLSWAVVSGLVFDALSSTGTVNSIRMSLGLTQMNFMSDPRFFRTIVVISAAWKEIGFGAIIFLAGISGINPTLYEAAKVDGATRIQQMRYITVPGILGIMMMMFILRIGSFMNANFEQIYALLNPVVRQTGDVLGTYVFRVGLGEMEYSFGAAAGLFESIVSFLLVVGANTASRKLVQRSIW